jgi:hypothetical protein
MAVRGIDRPNLLPLAAAWARGSRDPVRDEPTATLRSHLRRYAAEAWEARPITGLPLRQWCVTCRECMPSIRLTPPSCQSVPVRHS